MVDLDSGKLETVAELPGFTRGLAMVGPFAFVALSEVREATTFGGLPLTARLENRECGIWVVNVETGETVAFLRFEDLVEKVRANTPDADVELLRRAYVFSALEHKGQVRHSGEPYLVHPLEVANILADMRLDAVAIAAGLLHDVVEDTLTTIERIQELFGPEVAHVVEGVTKISAISFSSKEARQAETFRKEVSGWIQDGRVRYREDVVEGLENAPEAFIGLLKGRNFGKLVVRVS